MEVTVKAITPAESRSLDNLIKNINESLVFSPGLSIGDIVDRDSRRLLYTIYSQAGWDVEISDTDEYLYITYPKYAVH